MPCRDFTKKVVCQYLRYKNGECNNKVIVKAKVEFCRWMNTYTKFSNFMEGKKMSDKKIVDFWHKIVFYNYVQRSLTKARISPTYTDFKQSIEAFLTVLDEYKPNLIIFWGKRLGEHFPKDNVETNNGIKYICSDRKYPFIVMNHPSTKLNPKDYTNVVEYIRLIKSTKI